MVKTVHLLASLCVAVCSFPCAYGATITGTVGDVESFNTTTVSRTYNIDDGTDNADITLAVTGANGDDAALRGFGQWKFSNVSFLDAGVSASNQSFDTSTSFNYVSTYTVESGFVLNNLTVQHLYNPLSDWVDWTLSWTVDSGSSGAVLSSNDNSDTAKLYQAGTGTLLSNGAFASGTTFRVDTDGTQATITSIFAGDTNWQVALPDNITSVTVQARFNVNSTNNLFGAESLSLSFASADVAVVPEPGSLIVISVCGLMMLVRRRSVTSNT